jgi:hypothetical protein
MLFYYQYLRMKLNCTACIHRHTMLELINLQNNNEMVISRAHNNAYEHHT